MIREIKDKTRLEITSQGYEQNVYIEVNKDQLVINCGAEEIALSLIEAKYFIETLEGMLASAHLLK